MVFDKIKQIFGLGPKELEDISANGKLSDIEILNMIKAALAKVYSNQVIDDTFDNGMLDQINRAVVAVEVVINILKIREKKE